MMAETITATDWDMETDLLVAGAGPGGMTAALVAAIEGLDVVVCEKASQVGGTGATSAGTLWIPGNTQSRDAGFEDSPEEAAMYLDSLIGEDRTSEHRRVYLRDGPVWQGGRSSPRILTAGGLAGILRAYVRRSPNSCCWAG
ncbi:MAG: FAD-binding protein [Alphaproteobacteria bacterium]